MLRRNIDMASSLVNCASGYVTNILILYSINVIFYNFLFEYDMINFLNDCKHNSQFKLFNQLMNDSFYLHQNASNLHYIHIKTYEIYVLIIFTAILIGLTYIFIRCWFKKDVKAIYSPSNLNNIELIAVNENNLEEILNNFSNLDIAELPVKETRLDEIINIEKSNINQFISKDEIKIIL